MEILIFMIVTLMFTAFFIGTITGVFTHKDDRDLYSPAKDFDVTFVCDPHKKKWANGVINGFYILGRYLIYFPMHYGWEGAFIFKDKYVYNEKDDGCN